MQAPRQSRRTLSRCAFVISRFAKFILKNNDSLTASSVAVSSPSNAALIRCIVIHLFRSRR